MAQPARKFDDQDDPRKRLSAAERARSSWGMNPDGSPVVSEDEGADTTAVDDEQSALDRAQERWGEADIIDGGTSVKDEASETNEQPGDQDTDTDGGEAESSPEDAKGPRKIMGKVASIRSGVQKRKSWIIGVIASSAIVGMVAFIFYLPNLLMKHVMNSIKETTMSYIEHAAETRTQMYVQKYVTKVIVPSLRVGCVRVVSSDCAGATIADVGLLGTVLTNWRDNNIERKLFDKYGLEFRLDRTGGAERVEVWRTNSLGISGKVDDWGTNSVTREVSKLFGNITESASIRERWQFRSLLARKYGANKWCVIACKTRDNVGDIKISALRKFKLKLIQRIVTPRNERAAAYLTCFALNCNNIEQVADNAARAAIGSIDDEALAAIAADIGDRRIGQYLGEKAVEAALKPFFGQTSGRIAASSVPYAGQVYLALTLARMVDKIDDKIEDKSLSRYAKKMNEEAYLHNFAAWATISDDVQSGEASLADMGAAVQTLSGFQSSRVYQQATGVSKLSSVQCDDTTLSGQDAALACPENKVTPTFFLEQWRDSTWGNIISRVANTYDWCVIGIGVGPFDLGCPVRVHTVADPILNAIDWGLNGVSGFLVAALQNTPLIGGVMDSMFGFAEEYLPKIMGWFMVKLFPVVVNVDGSGQKQYDQIFAGSDILVNAFAKGETTDDGDFIGLGAPRVNTEEMSALDSAIAQGKQMDWNNKGFIARTFDLSDSSTLASSLAVGFAGAITSPSTINIFGSFTNALSGIFSPRAFAATIPDREAIFGVTQYAFPLNDRALTIDPEELTPEACAAFKQEREDTAVTDPETGEIIYTVSDPCALDKAITDSLTKIYNLDVGSSVSSNGQVDCSSSTGNAKIVCAAQNFQDIRYANFWGSDWASTWGVPSIEGSIGQNPQEWISQRIVGGANDFLECSGYVKVAIYSAFGVVSNAQSSQGYIDDTANFRVLVAENTYDTDNYSSLQPGDILVRRDRGSGSGHIGIFVERLANGNFRTLETSGSANLKGERKSGYFEVSPSAYDYVLRYIGPGGSSS